MTRSGVEKVLRFMEKHGWKLLHFAAYTDWPEETIKVLLKTVQIPNPSSIDIEELAQIMVWPTDVLMEVVKSATDINAIDKHKRTALHIASNRDNYRFVRSLMRLAKTDVDLIDERGWTAMHYAAKQGHGRVVTCLCLKKADTNIPTREGAKTAIHLAALEGHSHIVRMLYHHGKADIILKTSKGRNVVHLAASNNSSDNAECLQICLEFGYFNVDECDSSGNTALHYAVECGSLEMCQILVSNFNAKVNVQDKTKQTPLHIAAYNGDFAIVQLLVESGADLDLTDEDNVTVLAYAKEEKRGKVVRFLQAKMGLEVDAESESGSEMESEDSDDSSSDDDSE